MYVTLFGTSKRFFMQNGRMVHVLGPQQIVWGDSGARFMLSPEVFAWLQLKFCFFFIFRITVDKHRGIIFVVFFNHSNHRITVDKYRGITFDTARDNEFRYTRKKKKEGATQFFRGGGCPNLWNIVFANQTVLV